MTNDCTDCSKANLSYWNDLDLYVGWMDGWTAISDRPTTIAPLKAVLTKKKKEAVHKQMPGPGKYRSGRKSSKRSRKEKKKTRCFQNTPQASTAEKWQHLLFYF